MRFPIWFVVEQSDESTSICCNDSGAAIGFTTTEKLIPFLFAGRAKAWRIEVATEPEELLLLVADLHRQGTTHLCLDADEEGRHGRITVALTDVLSFARRAQAGVDERWDAIRSHRAPPDEERLAV